MTKGRVATLALLIFTSSVAMLWGFLLEKAAKGRMADFKLAYYDTQCLLNHCDPYSESEVWRVYTAEGGQVPTDALQRGQVIQKMPLQVYSPTAFPFFAPFAMLSWGPAHLFWMVLTAGSLTLAGFLMWVTAAKFAPDVAFYLICFLLVNSGVAFAGGNPAGLVVSLCAIAAWCFIQERAVFFGVTCLAISLAIKPHDSGFVWLYFLLVGGVHRKRALQTLVVVAALTIPAFLWVTHIAPNWLYELQTNLSITSAPGGNGDPGPAGGLGVSPGMIIDLQTIFSLIRDDPHFYNPITYLICGPLFIVWIVVTLRSRFSLTNAWIALAAISALSMLPLYHRPHDAKLLVLTIPACAMLVAEGGGIGRIALFLNTAAVLFISDIPLAVLGLFTNRLHLTTEGLIGKAEAILLARPIPLVLLALTVFYLWVYIRRGARAISCVSSRPCLVTSEPAGSV